MIFGDETVVLSSIPCPRTWKSVWTRTQHESVKRSVTLSMGGGPNPTIYAIDDNTDSNLDDRTEPSINLESLQLHQETHMIYSRVQKKGHSGSSSDTMSDESFKIKLFRILFGELEAQLMIDEWLALTKAKNCEQLLLLLFQMQYRDEHLRKAWRLLNLYFTELRSKCVYSTESAESKRARENKDILRLLEAMRNLQLMAQHLESETQLSNGPDPADRKLVFPKSSLLIEFHERKGEMKFEFASRKTRSAFLEPYHSEETFPRVHCSSDCIFVVFKASQISPTLKIVSLNHQGQTIPPGCLRGKTHHLAVDPTTVLTAAADKGEKANCLMLVWQTSAGVYLRNCSQSLEFGIPELLIERNTTQARGTERFTRMSFSVIGFLRSTFMLLSGHEISTCTVKVYLYKWNQLSSTWDLIVNQAFWSPVEHVLLPSLIVTEGRLYLFSWIAEAKYGYKIIRPNDPEAQIGGKLVFDVQKCYRVGSPMKDKSLPSLSIPLLLVDRTHTASNSHRTIEVLKLLLR